MRPLDEILLEREAALAAFDLRVAALRTGTPAGGCVLLSGEAGIGGGWLTYVWPVGVVVATSPPGRARACQPGDCLT